MAPVEPEQPSVEPPPPAIPGYRIERLLGRGGFGRVYLASRELDGLQVAIKIVDDYHPDGMARLLREAEALRAIGPPFVPLVHATGSLAQRAYIVLELVALPTLADRLGRIGGPMPESEFATIGLAIVDALDAAHRRGFVHRDLKPENIFVDDSSAAKLIDFGLAKLAMGSQDGSRTAVGTIQGTTEYMAPEQCEGRRDQDARVDVYAVGILLYEMATGRVPFFGPSASEVQQAHRARRPRRISEFANVAPAVEAVVMRCLAKDPERRYADAGELRFALREALQQAPARAAREPVLTPPPITDGGVGTPNRQRRALPLLFFSSATATPEVQALVEVLGGRLASISPPRYVAVLEGGTEHPLRRACAAARALLKRVCHQVLVDTSVVTIAPRPDGPPRYLSAAFSADALSALGDSRPGLFLTSGAAAALPEMSTEPITGRSDVLRVINPSETNPPTALRAAAAPLIGREDLLDRLLSCARRSVETRRPRLMTVFGEIGYGKSHLAAVLTERLQTLPRADVIDLRATEPIGGDAEETLRALLRRLLQLENDLPPETVRQRFTTALADDDAAALWPAIGLVLGCLPTNDPAVRALMAAPGALRSSSARAAGLLLRRRASARPLCLVVDDAHFADHPTLDALEFATISDGAAPIFICVLARPTFGALRPFWGQRADEAESCDISELSEADATALCRRLLHPAVYVPEDAVARLVEKTRGIPLLLVELVRGLKAAGLVRRHNKGDAWYVVTDELDRLAQTPIVDWLAEREVNELSADVAAHARLAAQLPAEFTAHDLEGIVAELDRTGHATPYPLDSGAAARRLVDAGLLVAHRGNRLAYRNALARDAIARTADAGSRTRIHDAAYRHYRNDTSLAEAERESRLAFHAARCGRRAVAADLFLALGDRANNHHAYVAAEEMYSRALEQLDEVNRAQRTLAHRRRGLMRCRVSRFDDALGDLATARELARRIDDRETVIETLLDEAIVLDWVDEYARSEALVQEAQALATTDVSPLLTARLLMGCGRTQWRRSDWKAARATLETAVRRSEELGEPGYETLLESLLMLGEIVNYAGELDAAEHAFDRVIQLSQQHGDRVHLASALNNRRGVWIGRKNGAAAVRELMQCASISRESGIMTLEFFAEYNVGEILYLMGDEGALAHITRAVELQQHRLGSSARPVARLLLARLLVHQGRLAEARALIGELRQMQEQARAAQRNEALFLPSEAALFAMVELAAGESSEADWDALQETSALYSVEQEPIELVEMRGLCSIRRGHLEPGVACLRRALEMAERIPNIMDQRIRRELARARA